MNAASALNLSGQVGTSGTATLVVPAVPVQITAWNWVPVNLPSGPGSTIVTVGGQKVNVTVTWQPAYVGFAGSLLIVPPQTTGTIVLQLQQPDYWVTPQGVSSPGTLTPGVATVSSGSSSGSVSNSPNLVPASLTSQQSTGQSSTQTIVQTSTVLEQASSQPGSVPPAATGVNQLQHSPLHGGRGPRPRHRLGEPHHRKKKA